MKYSLLIGSLILGISISIAMPKEVLNRSYRIESDSLDTEIPKGYYIIEGMIYEANNPSLLCSHVTLTPENRKSRLSENGYFSLILPISTRYVIFQDSAHHLSAFENYVINDQHRIQITAFLWDAYFQVEPQVDKPVLYATSSQDIDLHITLKTTGDLLFTYPLISAKNTWNHSIRENQFVDSLGNKYPYLFWDSKRSSLASLHMKGDDYVGKVISKDQTIPYLDSITSFMGFNFQEKADFITYWGPRLIQNPYNIIQFLTQEDCEQFAHYEFAPVPDHFNRFYILYIPCSTFPDNIQLKEQVLTPFVRDGFTLFEWGGTEFQLEQQLWLSRH